MRWENVYLESVNGSRFGYVLNPKGKRNGRHALLSMRHEEAGKPTTGWVFPGGDPAGMFLTPRPIRSTAARSRK